MHVFESVTSLWSHLRHIYLAMQALDHIIHSDFPMCHTWLVQSVSHQRLFATSAHVMFIVTQDLNYILIY